MRRKPCVFKNVATQMLIQGIDITDLASETYIEYKSMCKKLNGDARMTIEEAISIYNVLNRAMPMEQLFSRE